MSVLDEIVVNTATNLPILETLQGSPIAPYIDDTIMDVPNPSLFVTLSSIQDVLDFGHAAEKSGFRLWDRIYPPSSLAGDTHTTVRFVTFLANGKRIFLTASIENWIITELSGQAERVDF